MVMDALPVPTSRPILLIPAVRHPMHVRGHALRGIMVRLQMIHRAPCVLRVSTVLVVQIRQTARRGHIAVQQAELHLHLVPRAVAERNIRMPQARHRARLCPTVITSPATARRRSARKTIAVARRQVRKAGAQRLVQTVHTLQRPRRHVPRLAVVITVRRIP